VRRQRPLGERSGNQHAVEASSNDANLDPDVVPGLSKVCVCGDPHFQKWGRWTPGEGGTTSTRDCVLDILSRALKLMTFLMFWVLKG
jgi:hypothetical protein